MLLALQGQQGLLPKTLADLLGGKQSLEQPGNPAAGKQSCAGEAGLQKPRSCAG